MFLPGSATDAGSLIMIASGIGVIMTAGPEDMILRPHEDIARVEKIRRVINKYFFFILWIIAVKKKRMSMYGIKFIKIIVILS